MRTLVVKARHDSRVGSVYWLKSDVEVFVECQGQPGDAPIIKVDPVVAVSLSIVGETEAHRVE
jgi:hypothetical protein